LNELLEKKRKEELTLFFDADKLPYMMGRPTCVQLLELLHHDYIDHVKFPLVHAMLRSMTAFVETHKG